jgi:hypothetical protein
MSLEGTVLLAIWNDFESSRMDAYEEWHSREHVPERVSVTGIYSGTRLRNDKLASHRFLTLYDIHDSDVLKGSEYNELLAQPTICSATMRPDFQNFIRIPMRVVRSEGWGLSGFFAVVGTEQELSPESIAELIKLREQSSVLSVHVAQRESDVAVVAWTQSTTARGIEWLVLVEAVTIEAAQTAQDAAAAILWQSQRDQPVDFANTVYQVAFHFPGRVATERLQHRRAHWEGVDA